MRMSRMKPAAGLSIRPLGTDGDQRRRFLFHHVPLALGSALLLGVFMTVPLFDARAYAHGDIVSGTFPQARGEAGSMSHGSDRGGGHDGAQSEPIGHRGDH